MTRQTTERDRLRIRVLFHDAKFTKARIRSQTGFSMSQIRTALKDEVVKERSGRPPTFTKEEEKELLVFVSSSPEAGRMSSLRLSKTLFDGRHGEYAVRSTLRRLKGIASGTKSKSVAKPGASEANSTENTEHTEQMAGSSLGDDTEQTDTPVDLSDSDSDHDSDHDSDEPATGTSTPTAEDTLKRMAIEGLVAAEKPAVEDVHVEAPAATSK